MKRRKQRKQKPAQPNFWRMPATLWRLAKRELPKEPKERRRGRPRIPNRNVMNGLWFVLWTGVQWGAIRRDWFGVSKSVLHERLQTWQQEGRWERILRRIVRYYHRQCHIAWRWQVVDSKNVPAPLGGSATGPNPTDRGKKGAKIHILVDQRGVPLTVRLSGANVHDRWYIKELIISVVVPRPGWKQHLHADKAYDAADIHQFVQDIGLEDHILRRRKRGQPPEKSSANAPSYRWVVERTFSWFSKRRSIRTRWSKKPENFLAFLFLTAATIAHDQAAYCH